MVTYKVIENWKAPDFWRAVCCELVATAILIFIGCGSVVLHMPGEVITTSSDIVRIALAFGLTVIVLIRTFGPVSGCHVNPAVTLALFSVGRISLIRAVFYAVAQIVGSIAGTAILFAIVPVEKQRALGLTFLSNGITPWQGLIIEIVLSFVLLIVISACTDEARRDYQINKSTNPLVIGFTISVLHLMAIPYTGSSLNPARTFGPALIDRFWVNQWIYWIGPIVGGCLGAITYRTLLRHDPGQGDRNAPRLSIPTGAGLATISEQRQQFQRYGMISVETGLNNMASSSSSISQPPSQSPNGTMIMLNSSQVPLFLIASKD